MGIPFKLKMTWDDFWLEQQNNPNCELVFCYKGNTYILLHENHSWMICEYNYGTSTVGKILIKLNENHTDQCNYHRSEDWNELLSKCHDILCSPIFDGKSFKDIIDSILFE